MRATIRQAQDRRVIRQHGVDDVQIVFVIANNRKEQEPFGAGGEVVIGDLIRRVVASVPPWRRCCRFSSGS